MNFFQRFVYVRLCNEVRDVFVGVGEVIGGSKMNKFELMNCPKQC